MFSVRNSPISASTKIETDQSAKAEASPNVEKNSATAAAENGSISYDLGSSQASDPQLESAKPESKALLADSKGLTEELESGGGLCVAKEEPQSPKKESTGGLRLDDDRRDNMAVNKAWVVYNFLSLNLLLGLEIAFSNLFLGFLFFIVQEFNAIWGWNPAWGKVPDRSDGEDLVFKEHGQFFPCLKFFKGLIFFFLGRRLLLHWDRHQKGTVRLTLWLQIWNQWVVNIFSLPPPSQVSEKLICWCGRFQEQKVDEKEIKIVKDDASVEAEEKKAKIVAEESESQKPVVGKDRNVDLQFDLEKSDRDSGSGTGGLTGNKQQQHVQKQQQQPPPVPEKTGKVNGSF